MKSLAKKLAQKCIFCTPNYQYQLEFIVACNKSNYKICFHSVSYSETFLPISQVATRQSPPSRDTSLTRHPPLVCCDHTTGQTHHTSVHHTSHFSTPPCSSTPLLSHHTDALHGRPRGATTPTTIL